MLTAEPVDYMERTRLFYEAQGYDEPYRWAHHRDVPFQPLRKPLSSATIAVVATATPPGADGGLVLPKQVFSLPANAPPERLYTADLAWDHEATHTEDRESYLPLERLREFRDAGRVRALAPRFHGVPTEYSQRRTTLRDAPELLARLREDAADIALLVPL